MISTAFILVATVAINAVSSFAAPIRVTRRGVVANPEVESIGRRSPQPIAADTVVVPRAEPAVPVPALGRRFPRRVYYEHYTRENSNAADVVARDAGSPSVEVVKARAPATESTGSPAAKRALQRKRAADRPTGAVKKRSVKKRSTNKKRSTKAKRSIKAKRSVKKRSPTPAPATATQPAVAMSKRSVDKPLVKKSAVPAVTVSRRHSRLSSRSSSPRARSLKNRSTPASVNIETRHRHGKRTSYTIINIHKENNNVPAPKEQTCGCPNNSCGGAPKTPEIPLPPTGTNGTDTTIPPTVPGVPPTSTGLPVPPVGPVVPTGPVTTDPTAPLPPTTGGTGVPPVLPATGTTSKLPPGSPIPPSAPPTTSPVPAPKKGKFDPSGTGAGAGAPPTAPVPPVARRRVVSKRAKISTTPSRRMSRRNAKRAV